MIKIDKNTFKDITIDHLSVKIATDNLLKPFRSHTKRILDKEFSEIFHSRKNTEHGIKMLRITGGKLCHFD